jgi:hypothetical protein
VASAGVVPAIAITKTAKPTRSMAANLPLFVFVMETFDFFSRVFKSE